MTVLRAPVPSARLTVLVSSVFLLLVLMFLAAIESPRAVAQSDGACELALDGAPLSGATNPGNAIQLDAASAIAIEAVSSQPGSVRVSVGFGPFRYDALDRTLQPATDSTWAWSGDVDVAAYASFGAGLYELHAAAAGCEVIGWVDVTGRPAYATGIGIGGIALTGAGLLAVLTAFRRGFRRRGGLVRSALGGGVAGIGLLVIAQQSGVSTATPDAAVLWVVLPGTASAAVHSALRLAGHAEGAATAAADQQRESATELTALGVATGPGGSAVWSPPSAPAPPAPAPPLPPPPVHAARPAPAPTAAAAGAATVAPPAPRALGPSAPPAARSSETAVEPPEVDPPRVAYARVECPDAVIAEHEFELIVGLAAAPDPGLVAEPLRRPPTSVGPYVLTVQVIADGFVLRSGESWRADLLVTAMQPYPMASLHLVPDAIDRPVRPASIRVMYSVEGHPIGLAVRPVAVVRTAALLEEAPAVAQPAVDMSIPAGATAPDLTVRIERAESQASGRLLCQLLAADPSVTVPSEPLQIDIGGDPADDLRRIIAEMDAVEGTPKQFVALRGIGLTISDQLPDAFWEVLREVAARIPDRPPTILFLSAEPYVPWELAVVEPPLDPAAPPFLSAQASVGRWVLGQRRPKLPPPATISASSLAVVSGVYALPGWQRLLAAEAEASDLVAAYGATAVNASTGEVLDLLRGKPPAELIHFAMHGNFDADIRKDGLILVDGSALDPLAIRGTPIAGAPFVFLNACQVGRGSQLLGDHAGTAEAFLFAGAAGVVAPLWTIDDELARQIALRFYERVLQGEAAADVLRSERAAFRDSDETISSTYLAYQFFGHPALRLIAALEDAPRPPGGSD